MAQGNPFGPERDLSFFDDGVKGLELHAMTLSRKLHLKPQALLVAAKTKVIFWEEIVENFSNTCKTKSLFYILYFQTFNYVD